MSQDTTCPENSTECLLRALIKTTETQTSPWEPLTFGFTVAIGIAAFLISFVAIFQGLLAAGPGRIKGSSNAVGTFAKLTKGRLSWMEFAWRTTAYVPILKYDDLWLGLRSQPHAVRSGWSYSHAAGSTTTGATWLHLLKCVGLDEHINNVFPETTFQPCATDFLPADIQAPPAAAELRCLAILAGIADPSVRYEQADKIFSVIGTSSQISFRDHPVLGKLAAFEHYHTEPEHGERLVQAAKIKKDYATLGRCTALAMRLAGGHFSMNWCKKYEELNYTVKNIIMGDCSKHGRDWHLYTWFADEFPGSRSTLDKPWVKAVTLMFARTDYELRPFPWKISNMKTAVQVLEAWMQDMSSERAIDICLARSADLNETQGYINRNLDNDLRFEAVGTWLLDIAQTTIGGDFCNGWAQKTIEMIKPWIEAVKQGSAPFPPKVVQSVSIGHVEGQEALCCLKTLKIMDVLLRRRRRASIKVLNDLTTRCLEQEITQRQPEPSIHSANNLQRTATGASVNMTRKSNESSRSHISAPETRTKSKKSTQSNTSSVDPSIHSAAEKSSSSTTATSSTRSDAVPTLFSPENVRTSISSSSSRDGTGTSYAETPEKRARDETDTITALLIVRAIVFACLLASGPDTSILWETDFKNPIVKII